MTRLKRKKELPSTHKEDVRFGTPSDVAAYRAKRAAALKPDTIVDVGAGAGFQTSAFARVAKNVIAVEIDKDRASRAKLPHNVTLIVGDALSDDVMQRVKELAKGKMVIFLDPERPAQSERRTLDELKPDIMTFLHAYQPLSRDIMIEMPPFLEHTLPGCEREYLSIDGKLNRCTLYFGALKRCDTSVVALPSGARLEHNVHVERSFSRVRNLKTLLEPDAALERAGLSTVALNAPAEIVPLGNRSVYLTEKGTASPFFRSYAILCTGEQRIKRLLPGLDCETVIPHGKLTQEEQRTLLHDLRPLCNGTKRLHLFLGPSWILTRRTTEK